MSQPVGFDRVFGVRVVNAQTLARMSAWVHSLAVEPASWSALDRGYAEVTGWHQIRDHMDGAPALPSSLLFSENWGWLTWPVFLVTAQPGRCLLLWGDIEDEATDENSRDYDGPWPHLATLDDVSRIDELCGGRSASPWCLWLVSPDVPAKWFAMALGGMLK